MYHAQEQELVTKIQTREQKNLSDEYKLIPINYNDFACNLTMGVFHMLRWGAIVYTPCA